METTAIQSTEKNITLVALVNVQPSNYTTHARTLTRRALRNSPRASVSRVCYSLSGCVPWKTSTLRLFSANADTVPPSWQD